MRFARRIDLELQEAEKLNDVAGYALARQIRFENSPFDIYRNAIMNKILSGKCTGKVLEIGSNTGIMTKSYEANSTHIILCDYNLFYLKGARLNHSGNLQKIKFVCADAGSLPFKSAYFDTVIILEVIEHLPKDRHDRLLEEVLRVCRSGANVFISTPNNFSLPSIEGKLMELLIRGFKWNAWDDTHQYIYSSWSFIRFLKGFNVKIAYFLGFYFLPGSLLVRMPIFVQNTLGYFSYLISCLFGRHFPLRYAGFTTIVRLNKS